MFSAGSCDPTKLIYVVGWLVVAKATDQCTPIHVKLLLHITTPYAYM